jgi:hypothetical protein
MAIHSEISRSILASEIWRSELQQPDPDAAVS